MILMNYDTNDSVSKFFIINYEEIIEIVYLCLTEH
jgi:hypothetical protein